MSKQDDIFVANELKIPRDRFFMELDPLIEQIDSLEGLGPDDPVFVAWKKSVQTLLWHALGENSQQAFDFERISFRPSAYARSVYGSDRGSRVSVNREYNRGLNAACVHLESIRKEVEKYFKSSCDQNLITTNGVSRDRRVFVVHGHDNELLLKVKEFLRKLRLEPIVLREQPNQGRTIIEKFESYANVGYAIVLLTPDDKVVSSVECGNDEYRARQNVILELGYFMGKLGRSRVAVLCDKDVARPNDIDGVVYTATDSDAAWQFLIAQELNTSGYGIDLNLLMVG